MTDSKTAQAQMEARAAALPHHPDYPVNSRDNARLSLHWLAVNFRLGRIPALAVVPIYNSLRNAIKQYEAIDWWSQRYDMERPMKKYRYHVAGTAAHNQTWTCDGEVECVFGNAFDTVMNATFEMLTDGKAVYGQPGIGCQGPYDITTFSIEQVAEQPATQAELEHRGVP